MVLLPTNILGFIKSVNNYEELDSYESMFIHQNINFVLNFIHVCTNYEKDRIFHNSL